MTMRLLVTGARGYVGGRLVEALGNDPRFVLRIATRGAASSGAASDGCEIVSVGDYGAASASSMVAACDGVDAIVHLAAPNEVEAQRDPIAAIEGTVCATARLLDAAMDRGVRRFVYLSTAHVYGAPLVGEIDETRATRPTHPYAITHRSAEDFVFGAVAKTSGKQKMTGVVLRLSNSIGAPTSADTPRWTLLVNDLCKQLAMTGVLRLRSSGLQARDFIPMRDVIAGIVHAVTVDVATVGDGLFNLGAGRSFTVLEMTERIAARAAIITGARPAIERVEPAAGEISAPLEYRVDKLGKTGLRLVGDFDRELDETIAFCLKSFIGR